MNSKEIDFLVSGLTEKNPFMKTEDFMDWFAFRREAHRFQVEQISFRGLEKWSFDPSTGNLGHESRKFFTIEGIRVETNAGPVSHWSQPIINQPEIGILGILTKKFNGVLYFLMQLKMEPGNINMLQLAPTVQATRSNYTCVHKGCAPPYLKYFVDKSRSRILVDTLQSEQGARFLRKRNRNIIIEISGDIPVGEDYCWLTLRQIQSLIQHDNIVNMDARSVLSCIPFVGPEVQGLQTSELIPALERLSGADIDLGEFDFGNFQKRFINSLLETHNCLNDSDQIISWFTGLKVRYELNVERIPLKHVENWYKTDLEILHEEQKYFSVIAVRVEADNREIASWTQPLIRPQERGIVAYIIKNINGALHFLVQAKVEPGNFDVIEMAPTVQCITGSYKEDRPEDRPPFLEYVLNAASKQIRTSTMQSEEGGRFFREENRYMVIEGGDDFPTEVPENFMWITMNQMKKLIKYNNFINIEGRCLLSCVGLV